MSALMLYALIRLCLKSTALRVDLPPLVDDPTADAEHVLAVVPLAFDHLEIRERDIGVNPLPLRLHGTGDLRDRPDEHPIREPDQLSKGPRHGAQRPTARRPAEREQPNDH